MTERRPEEAAIPAGVAGQRDDEESEEERPADDDVEEGSLESFPASDPPSSWASPPG